MELFRLESLVVLPFRPEVKPLSSSGRISPDTWETTFTLGYQQRLDIATLSIDVSLCTIVNTETCMPFNGSQEQAKNWARNNTASIVNDRILPRLNSFLLQIKHSAPEPLKTGVIRNVGDIDLVFSNLSLEEEVIFSRGSPTLFAGTAPSSDSELQINVSDPLRREWSVLTRAVDLVNHGYFLEAFVVGFSLLDDLTQEFLRARMPHVSSDEASTLLRGIESARLRTYLGPLMRISTGESPFDDERLSAEFSWLNDKRNKLIHTGEGCTRREAKRGLQTVFDILSFLNDKGGDYSLPTDLKFWS